MGRRGPPPKPTRLRILNGNASRRPLNADEPRPAEREPEQPAWLTGEAKTEWARIVPELKLLRLLTVVDRAALTAYCQAWAELAECTRLLEQEGRIFYEPVIGKKKNKKGVETLEVVGNKVKAHPICRLQRDAFARVKAFLGEFGLSPASRSKVQAPPAEEKLDPLEELKRRAQKNRP